MICREGCQINAAPAAHKSLRKCPTRWQNGKEIENLPPELIFLPVFKNDMKVDWSKECAWLWGLIDNASNVELCVFILVGKVCYSCLDAAEGPIANASYSCHQRCSKMSTKLQIYIKQINWSCSG